MELKKLDQSFYVDNPKVEQDLPKVEQDLDFDSQLGTWSSSKTRGHGIVKITINGLTFAIPVRSYIKHNASYILEVNRQDRTIKGMGLDYSKALLIRDDSHVTDDVFVLRNKKSGKKLIGKEEHITSQFQKYVEKYIDAVKRNDANIYPFNLKMQVSISENCP
ncbi:type III toxin-antitoxin system TenpIN family toxin [Vibrio cholerae]